MTVEGNKARPARLAPKAKARIADLLAAMTLEEKIGQLVMVSLGAGTIVTGPGSEKETSIDDVRHGRVGSILNLVGRDRIHALQKIAVEESRLGIPLLFGLDVIHGYLTAFPAPLAEAAAFRPDLWRATARVAAEEAAEAGLHLTFAPMLDLARDPRWGRIVEGAGEDPHVGTVMAEAKVAGFQDGRLAAPDTIAATAKHFAAYGAATAGRDYASTEVSERTLHEMYFPAFKAAVEAGTLAIMPAFSDVAGRPMSGDRGFLTDLVRKTWGFSGIYISDYDAVAELIPHGVAADLAEAAALALKAGMDIDMMSRAYPEGLQEALTRGLITIADIDAAVIRVLTAKTRLGLFDAPYGRGAAVTRPAPERRALARDIGAACQVLLKNDGVLPLKPSGGAIALVGPNIAAPYEMIGPWYGLGDQSPIVDLATGVAAAFPGREILTAKGCSTDGESDDPAEVAAALAVAGKAEVVLLAVGEAARYSGEAASRARPGLTGNQEAFARAVLALGKPVVVLLATGRPLTVTWLIEAAAATLVMWYPGGEAGHATADLLSGARAPSGRLPVSWPVDVGQIPVFYNERPTGRPFVPGEHFTTQYVDLPNAPLFPFGFGLSYTAFEIGAPRPDRREFAAGEPLFVTVDVANTGAVAGATTVFLFLRDRVASTARPVIELRRFETVTLEPGARASLTFTLDPADFAVLGPDLKPRLEPGVFDLLVGDSADRAGLKGVAVTLV
jgi:beta-glucosidase